MFQPFYKTYEIWKKESNPFLFLKHFPTAGLYQVQSTVNPDYKHRGTEQLPEAGKTHLSMKCINTGDLSI